jgi:hypothetical protein
VGGPFDPEDSFTYWVRRMAEGWNVLVRDATAPMQIIDVRDLAALLDRCAATGAVGAFDGSGRSRADSVAAGRDHVAGCGGTPSRGRLGDALGKKRPS